MLDNVYPSNLQPNIIKGCGKNFIGYIKICFNNKASNLPKQALAKIFNLSSIRFTYLDQVVDSNLYKEESAQGKFHDGDYSIGNVGLAGSFFKNFVPNNLHPEDEQFIKSYFYPEIRNPKQRFPFYVDGLQFKDGRSASVLSAIVVIYSATQTKLSSCVKQVVKVCEEHGGTVYVDEGYKRNKGKTYKLLRPFGYVDGISDDRGIEDVAKVALVREHWLANGSTTFGTFAYYHKIHLVSDHFRILTTAIAYILAFPLQDRVVLHNFTRYHIAKLLFTDQNQHYLQLAEAILMGRFRDGASLVVADSNLPGYTAHGFNYGSDANGLKCPFSAHARSANLRDIEGSVGATIIRRGSYYFEPDDSIFEEPSGLHFFSLQANIGKQLLPLLSRMAGSNGNVDIVTYNGNSSVLLRVPGELRNMTNKDGILEINGQKDQLCKYYEGQLFYLPSPQMLKSIADS